VTPSQSDPEQPAAGEPCPSFRDQVVVTIKILLATGIILGAIWFLDTIVLQ
jgi:hypothetical protein